MPSITPTIAPFAGWLLSIAALIALMVLVGGATRLTESGLSIVQWKPVTGTLPPLNQEQWQQAFDGYKTIPQYRELNAGMDLAQFKTIFWWEWSHRLLGRVIGVAFLLPFLWFVWRGALGADLRRRLWLIFGLGALQGVVGWWMVASGLTERVEVSQYRLATHLVLALLIYASIVWTLRRLAQMPPPAATPRLKITAMVLLGLTFVQLYLGALVAGLRAGFVYNTWPDIDGGLVPAAARLFFEAPWWRNLFDNTLTVQFEHRMTAYLLFALAVLHAVDALRSRAGAAAIRGALWLAAADHAAGDARYSDAAPSRPDRSCLDAPGRRDRGADARGDPGRTPGCAAVRAAARAIAAAGHPDRLILPLRRHSGMRPLGAGPESITAKIRVGRWVSSGFQNREWWLWIPGSRSARPGMTSRHCERKRSNPCAPQAEVWIASSLVLLAMTAKGIPAARMRPRDCFVACAPRKDANPRSRGANAPPQQYP